MNTYQVAYSLLAEGVIELQARSKSEAEDIFLFDICRKELIEKVDFESNLHINSIKKVPVCN